MSLLDVAEDDRWLVWVTGILSATILGVVLLICLRSNQEYADAFENGYEQICDPETHATLWKKAKTDAK